MTKKQYKEYRREWESALSSGRVVAYDDGSRMCAYPTIAMRDDAISAAVRDGRRFLVCSAPAIH